MKNVLCFLLVVFLIVITMDFTNAAEKLQGKEKNAATEKMEKAIKVKTLMIQGNNAFAGKQYDEALNLYKKSHLNCQQFRGCLL